MEVLAEQAPGTQPLLLRLTGGVPVLCSWRLYGGDRQPQFALHLGLLRAAIAQGSGSAACAGVQGAFASWVPPDKQQKEEGREAGPVVVMSFHMYDQHDDS